jgi:hypothetical protein
VFEYETRDGEWHALLAKDGTVDLHLDTADLYVELTFDQDYYLDELVDTFADNDYEIPDSMELYGRFTTTDPVTGEVFHDYVSVEVIGSGEVETDKCDFTSLTVAADTEFTADHSYRVVQNDE